MNRPPIGLFGGPTAEQAAEMAIRDAAERAEAEAFFAGYGDGAENICGCGCGNLVTACTALAALEADCRIEAATTTEAEAQAAPPACREHQPDTGESYCEAHPGEVLVSIRRYVSCPITRTRFRPLKRSGRRTTKAVQIMRERAYREQQFVESVIGRPQVVVRVKE